MIKCIKTNSDNKDFQELVIKLDLYLKLCDGEEHSFYAQYNKTDTIQHVIVAYDNETAVGCGAIKEYTPEIAEVKRMYVKEEQRGKKIASTILAELENWAAELNYTKCILETGKKQSEAIQLYTKNNYRQITNYGQYENVENSVCFEKSIS